METNGTTVHWHGLRQLNTAEMDGVPGVTQCPIAPGDTFTYSFRVTQYGSTWYHSHLSLQYAEGLAGPLILNGPATADYDVDVGVLFLQDWSHTEAFTLWDSAKLGAPPTLETGLLNGTNTYNDGGSKYELVFEAGQKYRLRLVNVAIDGHFQFSIDGHTLTVIAADLVPIVPYETDSLLIAIGQRYDVIVEANADAGDFWIRSGWVTACSTNGDPDGMTGILRYDSSSTADPTTTSSVTATATCGDEDSTNLVPYLSLDVGTMLAPNEQDLSFVFDDYFKWTLNGSSLLLDWADPTLVMVNNGDSIFPTDYNVIAAEVSSPLTP